LVVPAFRYGITNNWDVGLAIPIVNTFVRVRNTVALVVEADRSNARYRYRRDAQGTVIADAQGVPIADFFDPTTNQPVPLPSVRFVRSQRQGVVRKAAGSATGVGDITLRTKYRFWPTETGGAAVGLNLLLPSGEENDFHGTGETRISGQVAASHVFGDWFEPHLNLGIELSADDVDRSSFFYAVGATGLLVEKLGVVVDIIGRNEFGRLSVQIPDTAIFKKWALNKSPKDCTADQPCTAREIRSPFFALPIERNEIVDFSFGLRYPLGTWGSIFFSGIIPLNNDGFRATFIPSAGVEYSFL
jgi:hypothetical protein